MNEKTIPTHVGYILDGNRRWARERGLPTYEGHIAGATAFEEVIKATCDVGVKYVSFYTWSTENWNRAEGEIRDTFDVIRKFFARDFKKMMKDNGRFVALGDRETIPSDIRELIEHAEDESKNNTRATLAMCFNYGGQQEILRATRRMIAEGVAADDVNADTFEKYLDHPEIPPCDVIVRTSGEQRLSNFMLWRSAYSEFIFLDKLWPDMRKSDVNAIIEEYSRRNRRHGK